ncbi:MAG TPA: serine/threonine-protein kinase [Thermoanaerobaculia bacterium]|nr:serine/threonine-protein kinase [Thermoanaerobaculia bacterium]
MPASPWFRVLLGISVLQVLGAVAGMVFGDPGASSAFRDIIPGRPLHAVILLVLAGAGALLLVLGRRDRRAVDLGTFFLLLSNPFTNRWLLVLIASVPAAAGGPLLLLRSLQVDSFFPYFFWLFARDFPRTAATHRVRRLVRWGAQGSLLLGVALLGWQLLRLLLVTADLGGAAGLAGAAPRKPSYEHYAPLMISTVVAMATLFWKARSAAGAERRRARLFAAAFAVALLPLFSQIVLGFLPSSLRARVEYAAVGPVRSAVILACLLSLPFTTAYAVLVHKVLDLRLLARRAIRYALARGSALALVFLPLAVLLVYFYLHSDRPLRELLAGNGLLLILFSLAGVAALSFRARLLEAIDRRFFREQYDARKTLSLLVDRLRDFHDVHELAELICREVDRALHLEGAAVLVEEPRSATYVDPRSRGRKLDASSPLGRLVADSREPLETELEEPASAVGRLPEGDRRWLADHRVKLIAPIPASDGTLLGAILLGAKKSGLAFLEEDRRLLRDVANSAAIWLELSRIRQAKEAGGPPAPAAPPAEESARECPKCGRVHLGHFVFCSECSKRLEEAHVPYVLPPNRFRFERRIGAGGMGLVYRACDIALGRPVAIKTLRRISADHALRLRREARAAAAVVHPHLAGIYGVETWKGTPMLVLELLEAGTLGQRIEKGVLGPAETVELGIAMAGALERLHAAEILHRDVKPNNIGFARDGVPKLMDFGIARMTLDTRTEMGGTSGSAADWLEGGEAATWVWGPDEKPPGRQLVGTLSYLSPEALEGEPAAASFDLWSLCVVLYECLIGRKLFRGDDMKQVTARILMGRVPDLGDVRADAPEPLARFFRAALHRDINRRPADAAALRERLLEVRRELTNTAPPSPSSAA